MAEAGSDPDAYFGGSEDFSYASMSGTLTRSFRLTPRRADGRTGLTWCSLAPEGRSSELRGRFQCRGGEGERTPPLGGRTRAALGGASDVAALAWASVPE